MSNVTFLGVEGAGKTVLMMAMLKILKEHAEEGWFVRPGTNSAFRFLNQLPETLNLNSLPHQTTSSRYLALDILMDGKHQKTFDILDYPGEIYRLAFLDARDDNNPESFRERVEAHRTEIDELLGHLMNSSQIFLLFNPDDRKDIAHNVRNSDAVWITNACLDYLHRLPHQPKITLLLTQIDRHIDIAQYEFDAQVYVKHYLPLIAHNFQHLDILPVSALNPTDPSLGLDPLFVRCLGTTPIVSEYFNTFEKMRISLPQTFLRTFEKRTISAYQVLLKKWEDYSQKVQSCTPIWFLKDVNDNRFMPEEINDILTLINRLKHICTTSIQGEGETAEVLAQKYKTFADITMTTRLGKCCLVEGKKILAESYTQQCKIEQTVRNLCGIIALIATIAFFVTLHCFA